MKKFLKVLGTILLIIAAVYFIPRIILWNKISDLQDIKPVKNITDLSLAFDSTYEISEGDITMQIPTYYASTKLNDYSSVLCVAQQQNKQLMVIYYPFAPVADQIVPGYSDELSHMMNEFEEAKPGNPWNLIYDVPDDIFEAIRDVCLADVNTYNFWSFKDAFNLCYNLEMREKIDDLEYSFEAIYEHEDTRAVVMENPEEPGTYVVMVIPEIDPENLYAFVIQTSDIDDITKLLNTFEFNSLF